MNKKLTVKNEFGKTVYCILSDTESYENQMMSVLSLQQGCGYTIDFKEDFVYVKDYRTDETVGTFEVLSFEDTTENIVLDWKE